MWPELDQLAVGLILATLLLLLLLYECGQNWTSWLVVQAAAGGGRRQGAGQEGGLTKMPLHQKVGLRYCFFLLLMSVGWSISCLFAPNI